MIKCRFREVSLRSFCVRFNLIVMTALLIALGIACSGSGVSVGSGDLQDLGGEAVLDGFDVQLDIHKQFDGSGDSGSLEVIPDAAETDIDEHPGGFLDECKENSDCPSGYCISTLLHGMVCSITCFDACPDENWICVQDPSSSDLTYICLPKSHSLCNDCEDDGDCLGAMGECIEIGATGTYCSFECSKDEHCPSEYSCSQGEGGGYCVPDTESCVCTAELLGTKEACFTDNEYGTCFGTTVCEGPTGWSECDAKLPTAESCNGVDDDCNDMVDEGLEPVDCVKENGFGVCSGVESCAGEAGWVCDAPEPVAELCDGLDNDCDLEVDEDFPQVGQACDGEDEGDCADGVWACGPDGSVICADDVAPPEICDGLDNDCDGQTDEGFPDLDGNGKADCDYSDNDNFFDT